MSFNSNFSLLDYIVFFALLLCSSLIGIFYAIKDRKLNNDNYMTGNRKLAVVPVCMSLIVSFLSANTMLGSPAEGTQVAIVTLSQTLAVLICVNVFLPLYYKLRLTSVNKYLKLRFRSNSVRVIGSLGFILCTLPYLSVTLTGPALALSAVTPMTVTDSILIVGIICTFYTSIGGIKAVIWTDVLQCILMGIGLVMVIIQGSIESGGFHNAWKIANDGGRIVFFNSDFNIYRGDVIWTIFLGTFVEWTGSYCVKQTQVQRYCCMKSIKKAKRALYCSIPGVVIISIMAVMCGIVIYAKYVNCDPIQLKFIDRPDQLMPYFIMNTMSSIPGIAGLFVASVFSGSLSSISSGLNALSTITWDDFLKGYFKTIEERKILWINRLTALIYGAIMIVFAFIVGRLGTIFQASFALSGAVTGPLLALFCLGIFFPFANAKSAIIGVVSGFSLCIWISIGAMIYPKPQVQLPVTLNNCSADIYNMVNDQSIFETIKSRHFSPIYKPEGMLQLYHVSYMSVPVIGFVTAMTIGLLFSILFLIFNRTMESVDSDLLSPLFRCCYSGKTEESPPTKMNNDIALKEKESD